jgi:uncharacterized paraquat-inducible protein A
MFSFKEVLVYGFLFGIGYHAGHYLVGSLYSWLIILIRKWNLHKSIKSAEKKQKEMQSQKLCLKCKKNPRPDTGIYCTSCQFMGGDKFK